MQNVWTRVKNTIQLQTVLACKPVTDVIIGFACAPYNMQTMKEEHPEKEFYFELPDVLREKRAETVRKMTEEAADFDGILIKNFDEIGLVRELIGGPEEDAVVNKARSDWKLVGDSFLYAYNTAAIAFYKELFPDMRFVISDELTDSEADGLINSAKEKRLAEPSDFIYKAYGYQPLMITNQCLGRNYTDCQKSMMHFSDEKRNSFFSVAECGQCYSVIYNGQPTNMLDKLIASDDMFITDDMRMDSVLLDFTIEDEKETKEILQQIQKILNRGTVRLEKPFTRGHHCKGIE